MRLGHLRHAEDRMLTEKGAHGERGGDARDDHRAERVNAERAENLLEREEGAGERRVEGGRDSGRRTTADQHLAVAWLDAERAAERGTESRTEHGDGTLAAGRT